MLSTRRNKNEKKEKIEIDREKAEKINLEPQRSNHQNKDEANNHQPTERKPQVGSPREE